MRERRPPRAHGAAGGRSAGDTAPRERRLWAPDGSVAYTAERAAEEFKRIKAPEYTATDVVLLALSSQDGPIVGRARLFKELFLFARETLGGEDVEDCMFVPYYRRPHSFYLAVKIGEMSGAGLVEITGRGTAASYSLTQRGLEKARARRRAVPVGADAKMRRFRECMVGDGAANALRAAFRRPEYAEYAPNTRVAHRYRAITWGRGV